MNDNPSDKAQWVRSVMERYEKPLIRYAARFTGDWESARDVVQDAFMKLCAADSSRVATHTAAWLYTVCRNRALDMQRKDRRMETLESWRVDAITSPEPPPSDQAERREAHLLVLTALKALPGDQQEAFRLKFQDNLTYREISRVMGVSLGTVSGLIARALVALREDLRRQGALAGEV